MGLLCLNFGSFFLPHGSPLLNILTNLALLPDLVQGHVLLVQRPGPQVHLQEEKLTYCAFFFGQKSIYIILLKSVNRTRPDNIPRVY